MTLAPPVLSFARAGAVPAPAEVRDLVIAGWTGRDTAAMEHHIAELAALGVPRPAATPCFYRVAASLLTQAPAIQVVGPDSSGEVEFFIYQDDTTRWLGVGSDHTDRKLEAYNVTLSKQACAKPIGTTLWRFDEVAAHWDQLVLRAYATIDGARTLYQEGPVTTMRAPDDLLARYAASGGAFNSGTMMFCGTLGVQGGVRPADRFDIALHDPVLDRTITHTYAVETLPNVG